MLVVERLLKATQHRSNARCKLARPKRLGYIIIGAKIKAADTVFFIGFGGEKDDREFGPYQWLSRIWRQTSNPLPPGTMISSKKSTEESCLRARVRNT